MTTMAEMERKIESLERRVQELEKRPTHEVHYHTHHDAPPIYHPPVFVPAPSTADPVPWRLTTTWCKSEPSTSDPSCSTSGGRASSDCSGSGIL